MNLKRVTCRIVGHRWHHHRMPNHTVKSTCQRCGVIEFGGGDGPDGRILNIPQGGQGGPV